MPMQHASSWSCMRFADTKWPAPLSLLVHFAAQYKFFYIIIIIMAIIDNESTSFKSMS